MTLSIKALHLSSKPLYLPLLNNIRYQRDLKGNRERKYDLQKGSIFRVQCSSFPSNMQHILWARYSRVLRVRPLSSKARQCMLLTNHSLAQNKVLCWGKTKVPAPHRMEPTCLYVTTLIHRMIHDFAWKIYTYIFLIKWSSSWLKVNKIFTKNQGTSYTGCVNLCQYKSILPSCTINIQLQKATQKAISTENYNTERQDSFKIIIQKVSITVFFSKGIKKLFRCSDEISVKPVLFHRTQKFCTCPWNLVTCLTVWKPCQIE